MEYLHTKDWCVLPLNVTGTLKEWLDERPTNHTGNQEDGYNVLLVVTPDDETLASADRVVDLRTMEFITGDAVEGQVSDAPPIEDQLVAAIGRELLASGNVIIIGHRGQFKAAHNTPQWRLWCAPNIFETDTDEQFLADLEALAIPAGTTRAQAREVIASLLS